MPHSSHHSPANSIPDNQLGLSSHEVQLLRYHQHVALSQAGSSRAASQASSQGRLLLDPSSLQALSNYFDRLMQSIQARWSAVSAFLSPRPAQWPKIRIAVRNLFNLAQGLTWTAALPANANRDADAVRPRRQCHPDGRRRDSALPADTAADRRAADRVRQDTAHRRNRQSVPCARRSS